MKYGIAVVCAALAAAGAGRAESDTKAAFAADEKAVGKVAADWSDAWNRHDAEGMASLFSERGDLINPIGDVAKGRPQILKLFQGEHSGRLKQSKMALTCEPARFFDANVASVDCDSALEGLAGPESPPMLHGHVTAVVIRDGERWSIASFRAMVPRQAGPMPRNAVPAAAKAH